MTDGNRERLIAARRQLRFTASAMAAALDTPRPTYKQWESGARRTPGIAVVAAELLAAARSGVDLRAMIIARQFQAGQRVPELAAEFGVTQHIIRAALRRHGLSSRTRLKWKPILLDAQRRGLTPAELAREVGALNGSVYQAERREGIRLRRRVNNMAAAHAMRRENPAQAKAIAIIAGHARWGTQPRDWDAILAEAKQRGIGTAAIAREQGVSPALVYKHKARRKTETGQ